MTSEEAQVADTWRGLIDRAMESLNEIWQTTRWEEVEHLAALTIGLPSGEVPLDGEPDERTVARFADLVAKRAVGVPIGYLTGVFVLGGIEVHVGPGVFVPRWHSELLLTHGTDAIEAAHRPLVLDLCAGSGAFALAMAHRRPDAIVHAVELDPAAMEYARRNRDQRAALGDTPVVLHQADVTDQDLLADLNGQADLLLASPPFMPEGADIPDEFAVHQPGMAIYAGTDGLVVLRAVVLAAARLLRPGGVLLLEHGHLQSEAVPALLRADGRFEDIESHVDLQGWPLYSSARRGVSAELAAAHLQRSLTEIP